MIGRVSRSLSNRMQAEDSDFVSFAQRLIARRLTASSTEWERIQRDRSPEAIHDFRVSARRLLYALDCFRHASGRRTRKSLRKQFKSMLAAGGAVRDRDIALELAAQAGLGPQSPLVRTLEQQREELEQVLLQHLDSHRRRSRTGAVASDPD